MIYAYAYYSTLRYRVHKYINKYVCMLIWIVRIICEYCFVADESGTMVETLSYAFQADMPDDNQKSAYRVRYIDGIITYENGL